MGNHYLVFLRGDFLCEFFNSTRSQVVEELYDMGFTGKDITSGMIEISLVKEDVEA